jgi:hypothetical protein
VDNSPFGQAGQEDIPWVLSFPYALRVRLATDTEALSRALAVFMRAVFAWLRRRAFEDGIDPEAIVEPGAVSILQRFGDAMRLRHPTHYEPLLPPWNSWKRSGC